MEEIKKYLDQEGLKFLWNKISLNDYPNNETLVSILNVIDETKADKEELDNYLLKEDYQGGGGSVDLSDYPTKTEVSENYISKSSIITIDQGGTGATSSSGARTNLGLQEETLTFTLIDGTIVSKKFILVD